MPLALPYGDGMLDWPADHPAPRVLALDHAPGALRASDVRRALREPVAGPPLAEAIRRAGARQALVLVNDLTRGVPYREVLPALVDELQPAAAEFLIAQGTHRRYTDAEIAATYGPVAATHPFFQHDADTGNVSLGRLHTGNELWIDQRAVTAEFLVVVSLVTPHYLAGYSGSRKSILPGIAGRETIRANHARVTQPYVRPANLADNVIHHEMMEAAQRVGVDFDVELVVNEEREIVGVFAGTMAEVFAAAVAAGDALYRVPVPAPADVVVVSAGGHPKDINLYQAQKAIEHAALVTAPGGTLILLAECREGVGSALFEDWLRQTASVEALLATPEDDICLGGHRAVATARLMRGREIVVVSDLPAETVAAMRLTPAASLTEALDRARRRHGPQARTYAIPHGGFILPTVVPT
ncbi:MAG: nickel-dependent lactate racemase [Chloroflexi bacterium]|nr:nickel-dependent lactate racemase [Chloroflexota bacterium]MBU1749366.1 nickel-dependent lactate racemase [Chloroflexota bacterium]